MRTAVSNGSWNIWKKTTCFIVDAYHYINHHANDKLCKKYCNPAPTDGNAPNLVGKKVGKNTQACEQLNAWLGGFESILKRMTSKNFNWFLHVMLFYHAQHVLAKKSVPPIADNQDDSEDEESGSSSGQESSSSEEESINGLSSDENSDDNDTEDTEDTTTNSDDVSIGNTNSEMVEEDDDNDEDEDEMEVD